VRNTTPNPRLARLSWPGMGLAIATLLGMDLTTARPSGTRPWCLTKVVERSGEETHGVGALRTFKAGRLAAVHHLLQVHMQERVGDVELMHCPPLGCLQGEHLPDGRWFDNRQNVS
jgi:hypothetical protein